MIELVSEIAYAKGWVCHIKSLDEQGWNYATLYLSRTTSMGFDGESVTGLCDITVENRVRLSIQKTSFYGYGLDDLRAAVRDAVHNLPWLKVAAPPPSPESLTTVCLEQMLQRFHLVARQLLHRRDRRPTLEIKDEYDAQDLLHALLKIAFDDVRPEEVSPSYAGSSSRFDFLLKQERTVVEVKFATKKLRDRQIGEQLIIDIQRYQTHPSCERLVCFVYDPEGNIRNPMGLETDLSGQQGGINVNVLIMPK